ncbi:hypothetical protein PIB30_051220 [Stylosanthes scabra]|uniref:Uncharacterized protein n=1 Tax=Stylosanthes scabra TaxID=79078 RepID=A0ABU6SHX3_9FABA|nr:hypothetical protein [Stylosanthes scabra]
MSNPNPSLLGPPPLPPCCRRPSSYFSSSSSSLRDLCAQDRNRNLEAERSVRASQLSVGGGEQELDRRIQCDSATDVVDGESLHPQEEGRADDSVQHVLAEAEQRTSSERRRSEGFSMAENAMVVPNSLAMIQEGKDTIVEEGGIADLVEVIVDR